jgi:excisionase family DNA binding protein
MSIGTEWRIIDKSWGDRSVFTVEEAAEILRISRDSAYQAAHSGDLPVVRIGRRFVVPRIALERKLSAA